MDVILKRWFISLYVLASIAALYDCQVCERPCRVTFTCAMVRTGNGEPKADCISMQEAIMLNNALQGGPTGPGTGSVVQTNPVDSRSVAASHSHETSGGVVLTHSHPIMPGTNRGTGSGIVELGGTSRPFGSHSVEVVRDFGQPGAMSSRSGPMGPFQLSGVPPQPFRGPRPGSFIPLTAFQQGPFGPFRGQPDTSHLGRAGLPWQQTNTVPVDQFGQQLQPFNQRVEPFNQRGEPFNQGLPVTGTRLSRDQIPGVTFGGSTGLGRGIPTVPVIEETFIPQTNREPPQRLPPNQITSNMAPGNQALNTNQGESWVVGRPSEVGNQGQIQTVGAGIGAQGGVIGSGLAVTTPSLASIAERFNVTTMRPRVERQGRVSSILQDNGGTYYVFYPLQTDNGIRVNITKTGFCRRNPQTRERTFCMNMCSSDRLCPRDLKCCPSGCSLSCIEPEF